MTTFRTFSLLIGLTLVIIASTLFVMQQRPDISAEKDRPAPIALAHGSHINDQPNAVDHAEIWRTLDANRATLREQGVLPMGGERIVGFDMPLKSAEEGQFQPWFIANFVDHNHNFPQARTDWACGTRTYDSAGGYNHRGTDFFLWPLPWKQMDEGKVHVVAAAPAVIVHKEDGNYDRHCSVTGARWNAVYVEHADGSVGWYGHLKSGSLTDKGVGDTLTRGEYIGLVGSSGNSTGPHLHFEVYDENKGLIDPFSGSCNSLNSRSWWLLQEQYEEPSITGMVIGTQAVETMGCGVQAQTYESGSYGPGSRLTFTVYYRDRASNLVATVRLLRPDGSEFATWTHVDAGEYWNATYARSEWTIGHEAGEWIYEVSYNGETYSKPFQVEARAYAQEQPTAISAAEFGTDADNSELILTMGASLLVASGLASSSKR